MKSDSNNDNEITTSHQQENVVAAAVRIHGTYTSPVPPASELEKYEKVLPGSADRILKMAEKQSSHRQEMETKLLEHNIKASQRGQLFGFIVAILVLSAGFFLASQGKELTGFALIIADVAGLVGLFIYNRKDEQKKLDKKKPK